MKIRDLMIKDPITITENASITDALERMKYNSIRHLPVVEPDNRLIGFLTLADLKQGLIPSMVGDVSLSDLMIPDPITIRPGITEWGVPQARYRLDDKGGLTVSKTPAGFEDRFKINGFLQKWIDLKNDDVPVHVGEWGVYNKTPHDVTLAFMKNRLMAMKAAGLGWALWNFRGSFGILDSERPDVEYEEFRGHKLDRQMLELLQRY